MNITDEFYINRCFDLALQGSGNVAPNPLVGAVIVHKNRIIGEGFHMKYGTAHAEVNAVNSVLPEDRKLLSDSTLYVSLEPCCIHGNTPPCTDLIIKNKIPRVVFSAIDRTEGVSGKSIEILKAAGCQVRTGILKKGGESLVKERTIFTTEKRPYIILKYAQSADGFLGKNDKAIWLSNQVSKRLVHKWRSEVDALMVGTKTAEVDNPQLTNRLYFGKSPIRIVLDRQLKLSSSLNLFDQSQPTWVITEIESIEGRENIFYKCLSFDEELLPRIMNLLFLQKCSSIIVEGGRELLESFINQGLWNEARVFVSPTLLYDGIPAPVFRQNPDEKIQIQGDQLRIFFKS